jgi:hypothetical protein
MNDAQKTAHDASVAAKLSVIFSTPIEQIEGGFRVAESDVSYVDVHRMLTNWRVVRTLRATEDWDRGYCYFGNDVLTLLRAVGAALKWDADDISRHPLDWDKNVLTGELRERPNRKRI